MGTVSHLSDELSKKIDHLLKAVEIIQAQVKRIKEKTGHTVGNSTIDCPACGQMLCYFIQPNGHIHGKCSTDGCLDFKQ